MEVSELQAEMRHDAWPASGGDANARTRKDDVRIAADGCTYSSDGTVLVAAPNDMLTCIVEEGCRKIAPRAFSRSRGLEHISLPSSVTRIGGLAFAGTALTEVTLPERLRSIGKGAFRKCPQLTRVIIPDSLEELGPDAFYASPVQELRIPARLSWIGPCALCAHDAKHARKGTLKRLEVDGRNKRFRIEGGMLTERLDSGAIRLIGVFGAGEHVIVSDEVQEIGPYAFQNCTDAESLELPTTIERIHPCAFIMDVPIHRIRIRLDKPQDGKPYAEALFPVERTQSSVFAQAFYVPVNDLRVRSSAMFGVSSWSGIWGEAKDIGKLGRGPGGLRGKPGRPGASPTGECKTKEQLALASSFAFNEYEGGLDVQHIFAASDQMIENLYRDVYQFTNLALSRLEHPVFLAQTHERTFSSYIRRTAAEICAACAAHGDTDLLDRLVGRGLIDAENIDACIEAARTEGDVAIAGYLLEAKHERFSKTNFDFEI